jgi:diguanylate cyclase (GGDEF)-like protein
MQEILEMAVALDTTASHTYTRFAEVCGNRNPELRRLFEQMAREETEHVGWWTDLLDAWSQGLVPDIADEHDLLGRLKEIDKQLVAVLPDDYSDLSVNRMLDVSAHLEFYMLDAVFGELTDLMRPGGKIDARKAYSRHVLRLIEAIEKHHTESSLAPFLARVLHRTFRDQQRMVSFAMHDQLTQLFNRRGILSYLTQWLSWSERYGRPLGVVLIDVDYFKVINDTWGHPVGDEALRSIAATLQDVVRTSDVVGRFGGDEFIVIAPESDERELSILMNRIVEAIAASDSSVALETGPHSVSVGGAWVPGSVEVSPEAIVAAADRSLYAAKNAGRSQAAPPEPVAPTSV